MRDWGPSWRRRKVLSTAGVEKVVEKTEASGLSGNKTIGCSLLHRIRSVRALLKSGGRFRSMLTLVLRVVGAFEADCIAL